MVSPSSTWNVRSLTAYEQPPSNVLETWCSLIMVFGGIILRRECQEYVGLTGVCQGRNSSIIQLLLDPGRYQSRHRRLVSLDPISHISIKKGLAGVFKGVIISHVIGLAAVALDHFKAFDIVWLGVTGRRSLRARFFTE